MAKVNTYLQSFNTGVQDKSALPRTDLERMRLAAEIQTNLMCKATGPGFMRPGLEYLASTPGNNECRLKEFVFGVNDAAMFEFTANSLRVYINDLVITRPAASCTITNGDFSSGTGWNITGINGGVSQITGGFLILNGSAVNGVAKCGRSVTTASLGVEHALRIVVTRGPVTFRCGSAMSADDYISETVLNTGVHSLAFTPISSFYVEFSSDIPVQKLVDSIQIEAAGVMVIPTPWTLADLPHIRISQSADVCFAACEGLQQRRIERRGVRSWSVSAYVVDDGPFQTDPGHSTRLRPATLNGNTSLTASAPFFKPAHVGGLFRLDHSGQFISQIIASEDSYTDAIRVTGINSTVNDRDFQYFLAGPWTGVVTLQRSYTSEIDGFSDVEIQTTPGSYAFTDDDDNSIYWYRLGFKPGGYTNGSVSIAITYDGGGSHGICRVTEFVSSVQVNVEVLQPFKNTVYTRNWREGEWSDNGGWPSAVTLSDGRLWWSGADKIWGSVSDAFASFDEDREGDSGPISRSIATGGVNATKWLLSLQRLLVGTEGVVATVKSSSLDEPLTPTNFGIKDSSTTGTAAIDPIKVDARGIFVERAGTSLLELSFDGNSADYEASQISKLTTDIFGSGVKASSVQRRPDTRIWLVLNDGSAVCMVYEPSDKVLAFIPIETDGFFESVAVLPSLVQDRVYFSVRRTINGSTVRYVEKMALDSEVKPATLCKTVDAFETGVNSPASATLHVGTHLIGETVVAWADGTPVEQSPGTPASFTVAVDGTITLPSPITNWVAGLPYRARYKSARLAYGAQGGTAMLQKKAVDALGLIMTDFVRAGIRYGSVFDSPYHGLDSLPQMVDGAIQPAIVLSDVQDEEAFTFPGEWNTDSRVCLEVNSPYTATFLGMVIGITTNER